jgi:uncharacterized protein YdgA (DUF945 family)
MRSRRRPLRVLLLLAVLSWAAFYVLEASLRTERQYTAFVHQFASGQESRVLESHFERGWLRSRAKTSVEVAGGAGLAFRSAVEALGARDVRSRVGVIMTNEIEHGLLPLVEWAWAGFHGTPVLARVRSTIEIDQESQLALAESIGKLPPLEAQTVVRTAGQADTRFSIRGEHMKARGEGVEREGRWLGIDGTLEFSHGFRQITGRVHSPGLESAGPERRVSLRELVWEFDLPAGEFPVGRMELSLAGLQLDSATSQGPSMAVEGLRLEGDSRLAGGNFGAHLDASAAGVSLDDERWGPAKLRIALNDVDGEALRQIRRVGLRLGSHHESGAAGEIVAVAVGVPDSPARLSGGPRLAVEHFELTTPHGAVTGTGRFVLVATDGESDAEALASDDSLLRGELDVRLPAPVLEAVADARARGELAEAVDLDAAGFAAGVRGRREAWIASLRSAGRLAAEGPLLTVHTSWLPRVAATDAAPIARAPAATPPQPEAAAQPTVPAADPEPAAPPPPAAPAPPAEAAPAP